MDDFGGASFEVAASPRQCLQEEHPSFGHDARMCGAHVVVEVLDACVRVIGTDDDVVGMQVPVVTGGGPSSDEGFPALSDAF